MMSCNLHSIKVHQREGYREREKASLITPEPPIVQQKASFVSVVFPPNNRVGPHSHSRKRKEHFTFEFLPSPLFSIPDNSDKLRCERNYTMKPNVNFCLSTWDMKMFIA
ncbi:hypothetical protein NH340_JMT06012 [Sarcoptes scabiei]|nr:hypothetical protein NH340_JMT06012 [Sarcoptes scabiei]